MTLYKSLSVAPNSQNENISLSVPPILHIRNISVVMKILYSIKISSISHTEFLRENIP